MSKYFSEATMKMVVMIIKEEHYSPEEIIFKENDIENNMNLFLITKG